jgi:hypothetical protein
MMAKVLKFPVKKNHADRLLAALEVECKLQEHVNTKWSDHKKLTSGFNDVMLGVRARAFKSCLTKKEKLDFVNNMINEDGGVFDYDPGAEQLLRRFH